MHPHAQVLYYVRSWSHVEALWFANVANQLMWCASCSPHTPCMTYPSSSKAHAPWRAMQRVLNEAPGNGAMRER